ncbi:DUF397 domain-containing protein [Streptomyces sp. NPDC053048]
MAGLSPRSARVGVRDSKRKNGPAFVVPTAAWAAFTREILAGGPH